MPSHSRHPSRQQLRQRHLEYFQPTETGEYVYTGPYYSLNSDHIRFSKLGCLLVVFCVIEIVCFSLMGTFPIDFNRVFYVMVPYGFSAFAVAFLVFCSFRIIRSKGYMMEYDYVVCTERFFMSIVFQIILDTASTVGAVIYLFLHRDTLSNPFNWFFCVIGLASAGIALFSYRVISSKYPWNKCSG